MKRHNDKLKECNKKLRSLEVWKFRGDKISQLWQDFTCHNFIFLQASKLPSCQTSLVPSKAFTMADRLSRTYTFGCKLAFTMAEILISLTIIGIIAAITLPALQANINEKTWATKRKALYSRMSQAISMLPSLNGYGVVFNEQGGIDEAQTAQKAAQVFISDGLSKVLKINNICDNLNLNKCGFPDTITILRTKDKITTPKKISELNSLMISTAYYPNYSMTNYQTAAFETVNGESILAFYNPNCGYVNAFAPSYVSNVKGLLQPTMCANFIFDLNGRKGPNKIGKDMGYMTVFYPTDSEIVAPDIFKGFYFSISINEDNPEFNISRANAVCRKYGASHVTNYAELKSVFVNRYLIRNDGLTDGYISSTPASADKLYQVQLYDGDVWEVNKNAYNSADYHRFLCVK